VGLCVVGLQRRGWQRSEGDDWNIYWCVLCTYLSFDMLVETAQSTRAVSCANRDVVDVLCVVVPLLQGVCPEREAAVQSRLWV
jgi:hypothetical protein